jgi:hypothetical protein
MGHATDGAYEAVILRAVRLAYRLGRLGQQHYIEAACRKRLGDERLASLLHGFARDFPDGPANFASIIRAAAFVEG